jgi:hypothetical protein
MDNCTCNPKGKMVERMILNLIIDDESDTIRAALIGDIADKILGDKAENVKKQMESADSSQFLKEINQKLLGKELILRGRAKFSQYSNAYEMNVNSFEEVNAVQESEKLIQQLESKAN